MLLPVYSSVTVVLRTASLGYSYLLSFAIAVLVLTTAASGNSSGAMNINQRFRCSRPNIFNSGVARGTVFQEYGCGREMVSKSSDFGSGKMGGLSKTD